MRHATARPKVLIALHGIGIALAVTLAPRPAIGIDPAQRPKVTCGVSGTLVWPEDSPRDPDDRIKARFFGPTVVNGVFEMAEWHQDVPVKEGRFAATLPGPAAASLSVFVARKKQADFLFAHAERIGCGANVVLELREAPHLVGRAVDDRGKPLENVRIVAQQGSAKLPNSSKERLQRTVDCDDEGAFDLALCSDGAWHVVADADGYAPSDVALVALPNEEPLQLVLPRGGIVSGRIVDGEGNGVAGMTVRAIPKRESGDVEYFGVGTRLAKSDAEGRFVLEGTCTGPIELAVQTDPPSPRVPLSVKPGERIEGVVVGIVR